ncbi:hypothetical protein HZ326_2645 [Fusarium oxysporum f. sp. albedinis]|nr:hypothetical protein HZ326_2645 [Fusarium oxysporum f. sp. albedinis]
MVGAVIISMPVQLLVVFTFQFPVTEDSLADRARDVTVDWIKPSSSYFGRLLLQNTKFYSLNVHVAMTNGS